MSSDNAKKVLAAIKEQMDVFYEMSGGSLDATTFLFSEMAEQPVPFPTVMELLGISEEQAKREGPGVRASRAQFDNAIAQAIDDDDTVEQYVKVFDSRIARLKHAVKVKGELTGPTKEFHERIGGDIQKIEKFFADLQPGEAKGQPMPPGLVCALLRVPPTSKTCSFQQLIECIERNLDPNDEADKILEVLKEQ